MIARCTSVRLGPNKAAEFLSILESQIIPLLRKQKGFRAYIAFVAQDGTEVVGITFWDQVEDIDAYTEESFPQVMLAVAKVIDGTPHIQNYQISDKVYDLMQRLKALTNAVEKTPQLEVYEVSREVIQKIAGGLSG